MTAFPSCSLAKWDAAFWTSKTGGSYLNLEQMQSKASSFSKASCINCAVTPGKSWALAKCHLQGTAYASNSRISYMPLNSGPRIHVLQTDRKNSHRSFAFWDASALSLEACTRALFPSNNMSTPWHELNLWMWILWHNSQISHQVCSFFCTRLSTRSFGWTLANDVLLKPKESEGCFHGAPCRQ